MLLRVMTTDEYLERRDDLASALGPFDRMRLDRNARWALAWAKMDLLDTDPASELLLSLYSQTAGRPANEPTTYVRSLLLMLHFGYTSLQRWVEAAEADGLIQCLLGTASVPSTSCHYDFLNRLTGDDPHRTDLLPEGKNTKEGKQAHREKLKKGDKWVNWDEGDARKLKERYWDDAACDADRWSLALERLLDLVAVRPSMERYGLVAGAFTLSGDGSALHIHSSQHGHRVKGQADGEGGAEANTHRYTAPDADIGWDSHEEVYFHGYTFFNISWHSRELGIDLPMFVAQRAASQHDALTFVSATAHMLDVNPGLLPKYFCHDSAADAAHIYQFLRHRGTIPIIDWNKRLTDGDPYSKCPVANALRDDEGKPLEHINERGVPVCACGHEMVRDGYDRSKMATKYRCPFAVGKIKECPRWGKCTKSKYGRVIKIYDKTNYKLFGPVLYRSKEWEDIYKDRTCTERINNRVLNDYKVQHLSCWNGSKHFAFEVMAAINIHLDAWVKTSA